MPLSSDEHLVNKAGEVIAKFQEIFGKYPGIRPAHAKGILATGTFTPSEGAKHLSIAPHFNAPSTPITVRFSNSTGIPNIPDNNPNADPRGIAVRFHLGGRNERKHTDIIAQSTPFFPVRTGEEFLGFLTALATSPPGAPSPTPVETFLGSNPSALAFVQAPKPAPSSYVREEYFSVSAFSLSDVTGRETYIRYHIVPVLGVETLDEAALKEQDADYLQSELKTRLTAGPAQFILRAQVAGPDDVTDDSTVHWAASNKVVDLGTFQLDALLPNNDAEAKKLIFDPIPRVQGVEASDDPLLEFRAAVYLLSGRERRAA